MGDEEGQPGIPKEEANTALAQIGRLELRGASANRLLKVVGYSVGALFVCTPGAMAFFAYAEGGTSLWAAIAFTIAVPGAIGLWISRDVRRVRRRERRARDR